MEEVDLTLVTTQKKAVMALVEAQGFEAAEFEWQTATQDEHDRDYAVTFRNTVSVLVHTKTEYFFRFEKYRSKYSPAHQLRTMVKSWDRLVDRDDHIRDWLFNLRSETEAGISTFSDCGEDLRDTDEGMAKQVDSEVQEHPPRVFVSHSTQDRAFVEKLATDLRTNGVDAWYSGWEIRPGDSLRSKIEEGLGGCEYFIIVLSKSSITRPWVQTELDAATVRKIGGKVSKIIPVKIEDCGDLPPTLDALCWEDFSSQPYRTALERVLHGIFEVDVRPPLGKPPGAMSPLAPTPPKQEPPIVNIPTTNFPIYMDDLENFASGLRSEGFDARADLYNGQLGLIVGPKGLDRRRIPPETAGLFFPLWELNHNSNRLLVETRRFHDLAEHRPKEWKFDQPYAADWCPVQSGSASSLGEAPGSLHHVPLHELEPIDSLVLKSACEAETATGLPIADRDSFLPLLDEGVTDEQIIESQELLQTRGLLKLHYTLGHHPQSTEVTLLGFDLYANAFIPCFQDLITDVGRQIVREEQTDNRALADLLNQPIRIITHILVLLESRGWLRTGEAYGVGYHHIDVLWVSPELKRWLEKP